MKKPGETPKFSDKELQEFADSLVPYMDENEDPEGDRPPPKTIIRLGQKPGQEKAPSDKGEG